MNSQRRELSALTVFRVVQSKELTKQQIEQVKQLIDKEDLGLGEIRKFVCIEDIETNAVVALTLFRRVGQDHLEVWEFNKDERYEYSPAFPQMYEEVLEEFNKVLEEEGCVQSITVYPKTERASRMCRLSGMSYSRDSQSYHLEEPVNTFNPLSSKAQRLKQFYTNSRKR